MKYEFTYKGLVYRFTHDDLKYYSSSDVVAEFGSVDFCETLADRLMNEHLSTAHCEQFALEASDEFIIQNTSISVE